MGFIRYAKTWLIFSNRYIDRTTVITKLTVQNNGAEVQLLVK
jgi:hypothetical protein